MAIRLFDSLTREIRELQPGQRDGVFRFYNCGPTVYGPAHIGNFRTFVVNDVLRRLLELEFGPKHVKHVRNITDVDDKTIRRAHDEHRPLTQVTHHWTAKFHADCEMLNCERPHVEPTATGHIREQIEMIEALVRKGHAYAAADGSVYFKVGSFHQYGRLSRLQERELSPGASIGGSDVSTPDAVASDNYDKEAAADFALWKAWKTEDGDVGWDSPWGRGRPGWHIECSAMIRKHLGETIDLHTGGVDLLFPHHENEIAQSECGNGAAFARHWYHSEHLLVDGRKMSKSLGNLYTLEDLEAKGFRPMALRYALLAGHPRKQLNFTLDSVHAAESALATLRAFQAALPLPSDEEPAPHPSARFDPVLDALRDDLNTPAAFGALFSIVNAAKADGAAMTVADTVAFQRAMFALGLRLESAPAPRIDIPPAISALAEKRWDAKKSKDFAAADRLRGELAAAGWSMLDGKDGYRLEPAKK